MIFHKLISKLLLIPFLLFIAQLAFSQDPNFHIYLCFGQSNMSGQGPYTDADKNVDPRFKVLRAANHSGQQVGEFYPAAPPLGHSASQMGPADFFGRKMVELMPENVTVAVANISIGGQSIDMFNKATSANYIAQARNNNEWWMQYLDEYGGDPYQRIIEMGQIAKQVGVIKGILFHQGESDSDDSQWSNKVKKVYEDILLDLDLKGSEVPFLIGELLSTEEGGALGWRNEAVAQTASMIPNGHLISSEGCPLLPNDTYNVHFSREGYQILGERYAEKMFELLTPSGAPEVSVLNPIGTEIYVTNESIEISAAASDSDGQVTGIEFFVNGSPIGVDNTAPFSVVWTPANSGTYNISVTATDNEGYTSSSSVNITVSEPQSPFDGVPHTIPGRIEIEEYDLGGEGLAYHEADANGNQGGASLRNDEVDIEETGDLDGDYNVGYILQGEWLEYTVEVMADGLYDLHFRVAADGDNKTFHVEIDGSDVSGAVNVPNTGGWQSWQTITITDLNLSSGEHIIRLVFDASYMNLNYMEFRLNTITSLSLEGEMNIRLAPNPFNTEMNIKMEDGEVDYVIYDLYGKTLEKGHVGNNATIGRQLSSGVYVLELGNGSKVSSQRIIKR